ncbi:MAG: hypothetical protein OXN96_12465 [Bryobacterales bacterium]|nr:hypothetical protein [Bryobacterales bacterium]
MDRIKLTAIAVVSCPACTSAPSPQQGPRRNIAIWLLLAAYVLLAPGLSPAQGQEVPITMRGAPHLLGERSEALEAVIVQEFSEGSRVRLVTDAEDRLWVSVHLARDREGGMVRLDTSAAGIDISEGMREFSGEVQVGPGVYFLVTMGVRKRDASCEHRLDFEVYRNVLDIATLQAVARGVRKRVTRVARTLEKQQRLGRCLAPRK